VSGAPFCPDIPAKPATIADVIPETHSPFEKVTEPLVANAERRMAAHAFLGQKFDAAHPGVADATARIEAAGRRKFAQETLLRIDSDAPDLGAYEFKAAA
jgi:hypothetical protein